MKSKKFKLSAIVFYTVIIALALVLPKVAFAAPVPDTGQSKCYDNSQEIPCPQPGEPFYGQDAQYTINSPSYTDLGNGVVKDNVTELEWQQDTAPGTYTWDEANTYCANLTLGGHSDWRLPTIKELSSLVDSSRPYPGPTINTMYFPNTLHFYSSSTNDADTPSYAWGVDFGRGFVNIIIKSFSLYVRAVRGPTEENHFGSITETVGK